MTVGQRALLERFSGGDRPLNRAIAAALHEIDRLRAKSGREGRREDRGGDPDGETGLDRAGGGS